MEIFEWILQATIILGVLAMAFIWVGVPMIEQHDLNKWCIEEGFDSGEYGSFVWGHSYCIKIENKIMTKVEVDTCVINGKRERCFVNGVGEE